LARLYGRSRIERREVKKNSAGNEEHDKPQKAKKRKSYPKKTIHLLDILTQPRLIKGGGRWRWRGERKASKR